MLQESTNADDQTPVPQSLKQTRGGRPSLERDTHDYSNDRHRAVRQRRHPLHLAERLARTAVGLTKTSPLGVLLPKSTSDWPKGFASVGTLLSQSW